MNCESIGQASCLPALYFATQNGLEPSISAVTGRRDNQLRHWAILYNYTLQIHAPYKRNMDLRGLEPRTDRL